MLRSLPGLVKTLIAKLPQHDYPVLNSRLFFQIWLTLILDKGITSLRDLFFQLNHSGIDVDISTFSKANKTRGHSLFSRAYHELLKLSRRHRKGQNLILCPVDSTVITLTSKLFWAQQYHQVKLLTSLNLDTHAPAEPLINFGQEHDLAFGDLIVSMLPENGVAIEDRGFASYEHLAEFMQSGCLFVVRIKRNWNIDENVNITVNQKPCRVVWFCDLESQKEYRLVTNLSTEIMSNHEIGEIYRERWGIELLWKFLKMHLKLSRLMSKSVNGVVIQIYMTLIVYLMLQLIEIPRMYGEEILDKLRYIQLEMRREDHFIFWMNRVAGGLAVQIM